MKKMFIKTFGCIQNTIDSDQIRYVYKAKGFGEVDTYKECDVTIINSCVVRESAENRVYGLIDEIRKYGRKENKPIKIIVTGCLTGWRGKNISKKRSLDKSFADVSFLHLSGLTGANNQLCIVNDVGLISISYGCNNFCSYCVVPFARGPETSVKFESVIDMAKRLKNKNIKNILLVGQNVNSYGSDLIDKKDSFLIDKKVVKPIMVKSMGKKRIPTLFPYLLEEVCRLGFTKVSFVSSNPWDFSDKLIRVIKNNKNVDRLIHLPIQSANNLILTKMNRGYTVEKYIDLVNKIRRQIDDIRISTDIIIGFPGETDEIFNKSLKIYEKIDFDVAYLNKYSPRSLTLAYKMYEDNISSAVKKDRWKRLNQMINIKN